ncbi:MAG: hypothetical protein ACOX6T_12500 [Myxococcales bacterium]|jgi:hypothetical protein
MASIQVRVLALSIGLMAAVTSLGSGANAQTDPALREAVELYQRGEFERALPALSKQAARTDLTEGDLVEARLHLVATLLATGDALGARTELTELLRSRPALRIDPAIFVPEVINLETEVRAALAAEPAAEPAVEPAKSHAEPPPPPDSPPQAADDAGGHLRLSVAAFGFGDVHGRSFGAGLSAGGEWRRLDAELRLLLGPKIGVGAQVGYRLTSGPLAPRAGLRLTTIPGLDMTLGGGVFAGVCWRLSELLFVHAEAGAEIYAPPAGYRALALPVSAGVGARF